MQYIPKADIEEHILRSDAKDSQGIGNYDSLKGTRGKTFRESVARGEEGPGLDHAGTFKEYRRIHREQAVLKKIIGGPGGEAKYREYEKFKRATHLDKLIKEGDTTGQTVREKVAPAPPRSPPPARKSLSEETLAKFKRLLAKNPHLLEVKPEYEGYSKHATLQEHEEASVERRKRINFLEKAYNKKFPQQPHGPRNLTRLLKGDPSPSGTGSKDWGDADPRRAEFISLSGPQNGVPSEDEWEGYQRHQKYVKMASDVAEEEEAGQSVVEDSGGPATPTGVPRTPFLIPRVRPLDMPDGPQSIEPPQLAAVTGDKPAETHEAEMIRIVLDVIASKKAEAQPGQQYYYNTKGQQTSKRNPCGPGKKFDKEKGCI